MVLLTERELCVVEGCEGSLCVVATHSGCRTHGNVQEGYPTVYTKTGVVKGVPMHKECRRQGVRFNVNTEIPG
eukprot:4066887-Prymnesium_polylepis.1